MEEICDKLVRDHIPAIIQAQGNSPKIRTLSEEEAIVYLNKKLKEEVDEYLENNCLEEMCDILEVIEAISAAMKFSDQEIKRVKEEKAQKNGTFKDKILLEKIIMK